MKKMLKIAVSMALALMMLITPSLAIIAPEDAAPNFSTALDEYFAVRAETLVSPQNRTRSLSNQFSSLETTRAQNFATVDENIEIVDALAEYAIVSSEINGNVAVLDVYEWSWLEYYADDTVTTTNNMGFGTEHRMTLNKINGEWVIVNDKYDESDVTGVSTLAANETLVLNYDRSLLNEVYAKTVGVEKLEQQETEIAQAEESGVMIASTNANQRSTSDTTSIAANYNPHAAIRYADEWVFKGYASGNSNTESPSDVIGKMRPLYYGNYPYYESDCVNYVSQCLHEGGIPFDEDNGRNNGSGSQWWSTPGVKIFDGWDSNVSPEDSSAEPGSLSSITWRSTKYFVLYWTNEEQGVVSRLINKSNPIVYPGNPVYYLYDNGEKGHAAICVGYNAAGQPIFNAHNRDVYHVLLNYVTSSSYNAYTLDFVGSSSQNLPSSAYDFGVLTLANTPVTTGVYFPAGSSMYFKFTAPETGTYKFFSESYAGVGSLDTFGRLYKESAVSESTAEGTPVTIYMLLINEDNNTGGGVDFEIVEYLEAGTYYLQVYPYSISASGYRNISIDRHD